MPVPKPSSAADLAGLPACCLSIEGWAEFLGISERTIRRYIKAGKLKASKPDRHVIITPAAVAKFLQDNPA